MTTTTTTTTGLARVTRTGADALRSFSDVLHHFYDTANVGPDALALAHEWHAADALAHGDALAALWSSRATGAGRTLPPMVDRLARTADACFSPDPLRSSRPVAPVALRFGTVPARVPVAHLFPTVPVPAPVAPVRLARPAPVGAVRSSGRLPAPAPVDVDPLFVGPDAFPVDVDPLRVWRDRADALRPVPAHECRVCSRPTDRPAEHVSWVDRDGTPRVAHVPVSLSGAGTMSMARASALRATKRAESVRLARAAALPVWREADRLARSGAPLPVVRATVARAVRTETVRSSWGTLPTYPTDRPDPYGPTVAPDTVTRLDVLPAPPAPAPTGAKVLVGRAPWLPVLRAMLILSGHEPTVRGVDLTTPGTTVAPVRIIGATGRVPKRAVSLTVRGVTYAADADTGGRIGAIVARAKRATGAKGAGAKRTGAKRATRAELLARIGSRIG